MTDPVLPTAENDALLERVAEIIGGHPAFGCGCCVYSDVYDGDACPRDEDGWVDHTYQGRCHHEIGRAGLIARAVLDSLAFTPIPPA